MFVAFFESIKYVGHLFPLALLRVYLGYIFIQNASLRIEGDYLLQPRLAAAITEFLPQFSVPVWYARWLEFVVVPHWLIFSYSITYIEFIIGLSFIFGFLVRPMALVGVFLSLNFIVTNSPALTSLYQLYAILFFTMAWLGAGRCLGFDYFFFKRNRGIWW